MEVRHLRFLIIFTIFTVFLLFQELYASPFSSVHGKKVRKKREICADGSYPHGSVTCCECAVGQYLKQNCNATHPVTCGLCEEGTFNNLPNHQEHCLPCTSCNQPNANLEEEDTCTPGRDAKCRCKKDHYCNTETHDCKICQPCDTCDSVGIKEPCTSISNTICNTESTNAGVIAAAVVVSVLLIVIGILAFFGYKYWKEKKQGSLQVTDGTRDEMITITDESVPEVDILPLLPDIAETLGWKDMKKLAIQSGIPINKTEVVIQNNPHDNEGACLDLLLIWVEKKGKKASVELVQSLRDGGKRHKAEKILEILKNSQNSQNSPLLDA